MSDQPTRVPPPGWPRPAGYANGISVAAGRIVFVADLLDHPAKVELEATAVHST